MDIPPCKQVSKMDPLLCTAPIMNSVATTNAMVEIYFAADMVLFFRFNFNFSNNLYPLLPKIIICDANTNSGEVMNLCTY